MNSMTRPMILCVCVTFVVGLTVQAQPMRARRGQGLGRGPERGLEPAGPAVADRQGAGTGFPMQRVLRDIDLTQAQRDRIRAVLDGHREALAAARTAVETARKALQEGVAHAADEAALREAAAVLGAALGDQAVQRVAVTSGIREILTPEQAKVLEDLLDRTPRGPMAGRGQGQGRGREGRGPGLRARRGPAPRDEQ